MVESESRWVLVIPHPDEPLCRVWAEAESPEEAEAIAERYARTVQDVVEHEAE